MELYVPYRGLREALRLVYGDKLKFITLDELKSGPNREVMLTRFDDDLDIVNVKTYKLTKGVFKYLGDKTGIDISDEIATTLSDYCFAFREGDFSTLDGKSVGLSIVMQLGLSSQINNGEGNLDKVILIDIGLFIINMMKAIESRNEFEESLISLDFTCDIVVPDVWNNIYKELPDECIL